MSLEWTHPNCKHANCTGDKECWAFPTVADRLAMVTAAFEEYSEADGTHFLDFIQDVFLLAIHRGVEPVTLRAILDSARSSFYKEAADRARVVLPDGTSTVSAARFISECDAIDERANLTGEKS